MDGFRHCLMTVCQVKQRFAQTQSPKYSTSIAAVHVALPVHMYQDSDVVLDQMTKDTDSAEKLSSNSGSVAGCHAGADALRPGKVSLQQSMKTQTTTSLVRSVRQSKADSRRGSCFILCCLYTLNCTEHKTRIVTYYDLSTEVEVCCQERQVSWKCLVSQHLKLSNQKLSTVCAYLGQNLLGSHQQRHPQIVFDSHHTAQLAHSLVPPVTDATMRRLPE
jgi:hypothetical protein